MWGKKKLILTHNTQKSSDISSTELLIKKPSDNTFSTKYCWVVFKVFKFKFMRFCYHPKWPLNASLKKGIYHSNHSNAHQKNQVHEQTKNPNRLNDGFKPSTILLWDNSANHCVTMLVWYKINKGKSTHKFSDQIHSFYFQMTNVTLCCAQCNLCFSMFIPISHSALCYSLNTKHSIREELGFT